MANKNQTETRTSIDELNESLSSLEQKVENNKKLIGWVITAVIAVVCLIIAYIFLIREPGVKAANDAIGQADITLAQGNDSIALVQYQQVADEYGYDAGNRAALQTAILLYDKKDYEKALEYAKKYDANETLVGAAAAALQGDCLVNLNKLDEAIDAFQKAISISDNNPLYTPLFMMKQATVLREQQKYAEEAKIYEAIKADYPEFGASYNVDVEKYLQRAQAQAK